MSLTYISPSSIRKIEKGDYVNFKLPLNPGEGWSVRELKFGANIREAKVLEKKKVVNTNKTRGRNSDYCYLYTLKDRLNGKTYEFELNDFGGKLCRVGRSYHKKRLKVALMLLLGLVRIACNLRNNNNNKNTHTHDKQANKTSQLSHLKRAGENTAIQCVRNVLFSSDERYLRDSFELGGESFMTRLFRSGNTYTDDKSYAGPKSWGGPAYFNVGTVSFPKPTGT